MHSLLITICGIDGSGKSTLVANLAQAIKKTGRSVTIVRPLAGDSDFVRSVKTCRQLLNTSATNQITEEFFTHYFSFNLLHKSLQEIKPALAAGQYVICDRYVFSHRANQFALGCDLNPLTPFLALCPPPDLAFYLDTPPSLALARIARRSTQGAFDNSTFLTAAASELAKIAQAEKLVRLDGVESPEKVAQTAWRYVELKLQEVAK